jgi:GAF domain-containing protein
MHVEEVALERVIGQLVRTELGGLEIRSALLEVTRVMPELFSVDGAGLLLIDDNQVLRYIASTDTGAQLLEAVHESTGKGPCVQALVDNGVVAVADLLVDDRWPDLGELLVPSGVRSVLGAPVRVAGVPVGSLNVYKREAHEWDESDRAAVEAFEKLVERLLTGALTSERREAVVGQLQHALESRVAIERAVGVLMVVEDIDAAGAFERIRRAARSNRRSVRDISQDVVESKKLP